MVSIEPNIIIVGANPAGLTLACALTSEGHRVTVLEQHHSFDREFRGELIQPGGLHVFDEFGLLDGVLGLDHARAPAIHIWRRDRLVLSLDYDRLGGPYGAPMLVPQPVLLQHLLEHGQATGRLTFVPGARVRELLRDSAGAVNGVVAQIGKESETFPADLVIACDGRFSAVRAAAGIATAERAVPKDVIWFTLPRPAGWPEPIVLQGAGTDAFLFLPNRGQRLQVGVVIAKGLFQQMRKEPIGVLHDRIAAVQPTLGPVLAEHLADWKQTVLLHASSAMAERWWQPGLLLLGDAAHIMSPVAGQGINTALQDTVTAARHLERWLSGNADRDTALAAIEAERRPVVANIQHLQDRAMRMLTMRGLIPDLLASTVPRLLAASGVGRRVQRTFAYGHPDLPQKAGPTA